MRLRDVTIVIGLWLGAALLVLVYQFPYVFLIATIIHIIEVPVFGIPRGRRAGKSITRSVVMTMVFGFVWWSTLSETSATQQRRVL